MKRSHPVYAVIGDRQAQLREAEAVVAKFPDARLGPLYPDGPEVYKCAGPMPDAVKLDIIVGPDKIPMFYAYAEVEVPPYPYPVRVYAVPHAARLNAAYLYAHGDGGALALLEREHLAAYEALVRRARGEGGSK